MRKVALFVSATILGISGYLWNDLKSKRAEKHPSEYILKYNDELIDKFDQEWTNNEKKLEYLLCLEGKIENNTVYLTDFHRPLFEIREKDLVIFFPCKNSIGTLHPHYNNHPCFPSETDKTEASAYDERITLIQCNKSVIHAWVTQDWNRTYTLSKSNEINK